jgi:hypothetical protein
VKRIAVLVVALFALSGGVATAGKLITSKDIKNGAISTADLSSSAKRALKGKSGPRGAQGAPGPQGPQGTPGPAGPSAIGAINAVQSSQVPFGPTEAVQVAVALCPAGQKVVSGGGRSLSDEELAASEPAPDRSGWFVIGIDLTDDGGEYVQATALCAPAGQAVAASTRNRAKVNRQITALVAKIEKQVGKTRR